MNQTQQQILAYLLSTLGELCQDWDYTEDLGPETRLFTQLGMESLDAVVLATSIQDHYHQVMPFAQLFAELGEQQRDLTVGELVDFIDRHRSAPIDDSLAERSLP